MTNKPQISSRAQEQALLQKLLQVPVFARLAGQQLQVFLKVAKPKMIKSEEVLWEAGGPCRGLYILLKGRLALRAAGREAQVVQPIAAVGEVAALTGQAHTERATAVEASLLLEIQQPLFEGLLMRNTSLCQVVCRNIIGALSQQLEGIDGGIDQLQKQRQTLEQKIKDAESELNALRMISMR